MGFEEQISHESTWSRAIGAPVFGYGSDVVGAPADVKTGSNLLGPTLGDLGRQLDLSGLVPGPMSAGDKKRLDDAVANASDELSGLAPNGARGMKLLSALPKHLQSEAISRLSRDDFEALLGTMSNADREGLKDLVANTTDPQRKLEMWGCYHKAHATLDAERRKGDTGTAPIPTTPEQWEQQRRHQARMNAASTTADEVDDEVMILVRNAAAGTPIALADVEKLIQRKEKEHALEMKYNLNLTNQKGGRVHKNKGTHVYWSVDELDAVDDSLKQAPDDHVRGNKTLTEIHRAETDLAKDGTPTTTTADHNSGRIRMFDRGARDLDDMGESLSHELGHDIEEQSAAFEEYKKAAGWKQIDGSQLTDEDKRILEGGRNKRARDRTPVTKNGKTYRLNRYGEGYMEVDADAVPQASESTPRPGDSDPWDYARTNPSDHFAEHYAMATHSPETVHTDLVAAPHNVVTDKQREIERLVALKAANKTLDTSEHDRALLDNEIRLARNDLKRAEATEKKRKAQFDIMRNKIFHTDTEQSGAEARLAAKGISPTQMKEFKEKAATASTPAQLRRIEARY